MRALIGRALLWFIEGAPMTWERTGALNRERHLIVEMAVRRMEMAQVSKDLQAINARLDVRAGR